MSCKLKSKMNIFKLAFKSIRFRLFSTTAIIFSLVVSLLLLFSVEKIRKSVEDNFTQTISGVDLIVGPRTGSLQLVLYSVFNIGQATNNVSYESYLKYTNHPSVEWTIPYSLGDGHRGYRVVGTNQDFFKFYKYRSKQNIVLQSGQVFNNLQQVVIGHQVALTLNYKTGDQIVIAHGSTTGDSFEQHDKKPFTVVGVMAATGTALDQSMYISLESMESLHTAEGETKSQPSSITSFFLKTKSRLQILQLQREITTNKSEPLLAVLPGVVLNELWQSLSRIDFVLKLISFLVLVVGLIGMMISFMTSLNERRRELSILRALGANINFMMGLILIESLLIIIFSLGLSLFLKFILQLVLTDFIQNQYGFILSQEFLGLVEYIMIGSVLVLGFLISLMPAFVFRLQSLKDGLKN